MVEIMSAHYTLLCRLLWYYHEWRTSHHNANMYMLTWYSFQKHNAYNPKQNIFKLVKFVAKQINISRYTINLVFVPYLFDTIDIDI
jgi:elongation factor P--beta-lysine ligase